MASPHISTKLLILCAFMILTGCGKSTENHNPIPDANQISGVSVEIDNPIAGSTQQSDHTLISGTFRGNANTGITVNGIVANIEGDRFYANHVPLVPGTNTLTATLITQEGLTTTHQISLTSEGSSQIAVRAEPESGIAPLEVLFNLVNNTGHPAQTITADFNGDGITDFTTTDPAAPLTYTYTLPGIYQASLTLTDTQNISHSETIAIVVNDATQMDKKFSAIWSGMNNALIANNTSTALRALTATAQTKYQPVFATLQPQLPTIVASYSPLQRVSISANIGEYAVTRDDNGTSRVFFVYLIKDTDGVWRIDEM